MDRPEFWDLFWTNPEKFERIFHVIPAIEERMQARAERIGTLESYIDERAGQISRMENRITARATRIMDLEKAIERNRRSLLRPLISVFERAVTLETIRRLQATITAWKGWQTRDAAYLESLKRVQASESHELTSLRRWQARDERGLEGGD